jgi:hypothetical protein
MSVEALVELCMKVGVFMQLVPEGVDLIPPKQNVQQLGLPNGHQRYDEQRRTRDHLNFAFYMLDGADDLDEDGVIWDYSADDTGFGVFT